MTSKNFKNTHNLIRLSLFLKKKGGVKIVIQQNSKIRKNFFPKNKHTLYLNISHIRLIYFFLKTSC